MLRLGCVYMFVVVAVVRPVLLELAVVMLQPALLDLDLLGPPFALYAFTVFSQGLSTPPRLWHAPQQSESSVLRHMASRHLPVPVALLLVHRSSGVCLHMVLIRISVAVVILLARDPAVGPDVGLRLVPSILSLVVFASSFCRRRSAQPPHRGVDHMSWFHTISRH